MLTERQSARTTVDFSQVLLQEIKDGTSTRDSLQEERDLAVWERNWDTTIASYVILGFNMAIAQLQQESSGCLRNETAQEQQSDLLILVVKLSADQA
jgi:hypothetical protein